jgi:hypothetical protein
MQASRPYPTKMDADTFIVPSGSTCRAKKDEILDTGEVLTLGRGSILFDVFL